MPAGSTTTFTVSFTNRTLLPIDSFRLALPAGFSGLQLGSASNGSRAWALSLHTCSASEQAPCSPGATVVQADGGNAPLWLYQSLDLTLTATAPHSTGPVTWASGGALLPGYVGQFFAAQSAPTSSVTTAPTTHFVVSAPSTATAGMAFSTTVTTTDAYGNPTAYSGTASIALAGVADTQAHVPTSVTLSNGSGMFTSTLTAAGTQTFALKDAAHGVSGSSGAIAVAAGPTVVFDVSAPATATAGMAFATSVSTTDAYGNPTTYNGTPALTLTGVPDPKAIAPTTVTVKNGSGTFSTTLTAAGTQYLALADTANGVSGVSRQIAVSPGATTTFVVSAPPTATAGSSFPVSVTTQDAQGNPTAYTGTAAISLAGTPDSQASVPATVHIQGGSGSFTTTLTAAGTHAFTLADTAHGVSGNSGSITVAAGPTTTFVVSAPATATAGTPVTSTVTTTDAYGNPTAYSGSPALTLTGVTDPKAILPAVTITNGSGSFTTTLTVAGTQVFTLTDAANSVSGNSGPVAVGAGAAANFVVTSPATATAGIPVTSTVTTTDAYGNPTTYSGSPTLTLTGVTDTNAILPTVTITNGSGSFTTTLTAAGTQVFTLTDTANTVSGNSGSIAVAAGPTTKFVVSAPATATAGAAFTSTVTTTDHYGNPTTYSGSPTVTLATPDAKATVPTTVSIGSGHGSFTTTLALAGAQTLTLTDTALTATGSSQPIAVSPAAAHALTVTPSAGSVTAGGNLSVTVGAQDAYGNTATGTVDSVTLSGPGGTTLGTHQFVASDQGSYTFSLTSPLTKAGTAALVATDTTTPSVLPGSAQVIVAAGAVAAVTITSVSNTSVSPPTPALVAGGSFTTTVAFADAYGNPAALTNASQLTLTASGPGALAGAPAVTLGAGGTTASVVATYTTAAPSVTLTASVPGATSGTALVAVGYQVTSVPASTSPINLVSQGASGATCVVGGASGQLPTCSSSSLPHGSASSVSLYETPCGTVVGVGTITNCVGLAVVLNASIQGLYTPTSPAQVAITCYAAICPHPEKESPSGPGENAITELREDVTANPLYMSVTLPTGTVTGVVNLCAKTGVIPTGSYFCVDPSPRLSYRTGANETGNLVETVDFYGDALLHHGA